MKGIPQGRYTKEFREEAVKLVTEENISSLEIVSSLLRSARDILGLKDMILRPFRTIPFLLVFVAILLAVMLILVGAEPTEAG